MTYCFYVEQSVKQNVLQAMKLFDSGDFHPQEQKKRPGLPAGVFL
jgi:hypothetical protein